MATSIARRFGALPLGFVALAACGSATELEVDTDAGRGLGDGSVGVDTGTGGDTAPDGAPSDASHADGGPVVDSGPRMCTPSCKSDFECQSTCPAAPGNGVSCCDLPSGVCFAASPGMCPRFVHDASLD